MPVVCCASLYHICTSALTGDSLCCNFIYYLCFVSLVSILQFLGCKVSGSLGATQYWSKWIIIVIISQVHHGYCIWVCYLLHRRWLHNHFNLMLQIYCYQHHKQLSVCCHGDQCVASVCFAVPPDLIETAYWVACVVVSSEKTQTMFVGVV